jgi:hypothetical protein
MNKQLFNWQFDFQFAADCRYHPHRKQGMASQLKEVIVYAYTLYA